MDLRPQYKPSRDDPGISMSGTAPPARLAMHVPPIFNPWGCENNPLQPISVAFQGLLRGIMRAEPNFPRHC